jgi:hypothetical protein
MLHDAGGGVFMMQRLRMLVLPLILGSLLLVVAQRAMVAATSYGQPRELWDTAIGTFELGIDIFPARPGQAGYVEMWYCTPNADDLTLVGRIYGAPALPQPALRPLPTPPPLPAPEPPDSDMVEYRSVVQRQL